MHNEGVCRDKKKLCSNSWGFTLIELMLVVAIVGLLSAIAIPRFADLVDKAREAKMKANLGVLRSALSLYYADNEGLFPKYLSLSAAVNQGMCHLHPKYVDFNQITFVAPRYAGGGGGTPIPAMDRYCGNILNIMAFNSDSIVGSPPQPIHTASVIPSYWNYVVGPTPVQATIRTYALNLNTFQPLIDLKGTPWSLW